MGLKEEVEKKERMCTLLKPVHRALWLNGHCVLTKETIKVYRIDPDTVERTISETPVDTIIDTVGTSSIVFYGAPGKGKTPLAESLAAEQSHYRKLEGLCGDAASIFLAKAH